MAVQAMLLCVSLNSSTLSEMQADCARALAGGADLVELRLDRLHPAELERINAVEDWLKLHAERLLVTCRPVTQGGGYDGLTADRAATLLWAASLGTRFVDFEYAAYTQSEKLQKKLILLTPGGRGQGRNLILSQHDFETRPPTLQRQFLDMSATPSEVIKLVWRARQGADNFEAFDLQRAGANRAAIFCVDTDGLPSRVLGRKLGAALTYCALAHGDETAPGQPTLDELLNHYHWRSIDEHTEVYGLIGDPVAHSISPRVHNAALAEAGINAVYVPFRIEGDGFAFADFIKAVAERPWLDIRGFSVTAPHKHNAWILTREDLDPVAERTGSVNTLRFEADNVIGSNTDYRAALKWITTGLKCGLPDLADTRVDVLGAGGFARSVVAGLRLLRAHVTVYNRTPARAGELAESFNCRAAQLDPGTRFPGDALINCTAVGVWPKVQESPISAEQIRAGSVVFDAVYNPLKTRLLADAGSRGCRVVSGLELFLEQAAMQFATLTGREPSMEVMRTAALSALRS